LTRSSNCTAQPWLERASWFAAEDKRLTWGRDRYGAQRRLKVDVSSVTAGARVKAVLTRLLEPAPEDRLQSAAAAAAALRGEGRLGLVEGDAASTDVSASSPRGVLRQPKGSKVQLVRRGDEQLSVTIPVRAHPASLAKRWETIC
jgi:hypothetical protein